MISHEAFKAMVREVMLSNEVLEAIVDRLSPVVVPVIRSAIEMELQSIAREDIRAAVEKEVESSLVVRLRLKADPANR